VHFQASLPANPAAQKPLAQPVNVHQHVLVGLFHIGHGVGFQTQLFSDKSFYEHLVRSFRIPWSGNYEGKPMRGAPQSASIHNLKHSKDFNCHYTFGTGTLFRAMTGLDICPVPPADIEG
jgi:hypothetical protein